MEVWRSDLDRERAMASQKFRFDQLVNRRRFRISNQSRRQLERNGFLIIPVAYEQPYFIYEANQYEAIPNFVRLHPVHPARALHPHARIDTILYDRYVVWADPLYLSYGCTWKSSCPLPVCSSAGTFADLHALPS